MSDTPDTFEKLPAEQPAPAPRGVTWWLAEAFTVFLNGAISGLPTGGVVGGGAAVGVSAQSANTITLTALAGFILGCAANGAKRVLVWHDANPFPNPWFP